MPYVVRFDANGGLGSMAAQPFVYGAPQALSPNAFVYGGHAFRAWSTSPTGDGAVFADGETVSNLRDTYGVAVLYALWDDVVYTVSFDSAGGTPVPSASVAWGSQVDRPADPVRTWYSLEGWFADGGLTDEWDFASDRVAGDTLLRAKWAAVRYAIVYALDGGEDPGNPSWYTVESGGIVLKDPARDGWEFLGWYADAGLTERVAGIPAGSTGDVILYAKWAPEADSVGLGLAAGAVAAVLAVVLGSLLITRRR